MKLLTFYGTETKLDRALINFLQKRKYYCSRANCFDEIDQIGKQRKKIFLIFNEFNKAVETIKELPIADFSIEALLFIPSTESLTPEQKKELEVYCIPFFNDKELKDFITYVENVISRKPEASNDFSDLEFSAQKKSS